MEEAVCFRCHSLFVSYRALEVHLMSCDVPFDPTRSTPWAFIPPPEAYRSGSEPRPRHPSAQSRNQQPQNRHPSSMNRQQQTPRVLPQPSNKPKPRKSDYTSAFSPLPPRDRADKADRSRERPFPGTSKMAKCTKCDITFPDPRSLGEHFVESPAHPYSVRAPSNSWDPPGSKAEPTGKSQSSHVRNKTQPHDTKEELKPLFRGWKSADSAKTSRTAESGKASQTNSSSAKHDKDDMKEGIDSRLAATGAEEDSETSQDQVWAGDELDDLTSAFTKLSTV